MRQDRREPTIRQAGEKRRKLRGDTVIAKFDQQIICLPNGIGLRMLQNAFQIFKGQVKVAPEAELQRGTRFLSKLIEQFGEIGAIVSISIVSVRSSDGMG